MTKYIYRRPPYPEYDMEGIESWLEDLAAQGLMLDYNGYVFGFMQFQRHEPKKLKYRLEAIPKKNPYGFKDPPDPREQAQNFYKEFGWEYLGQFFDYYIYRSLDENTVELNTDLSLQAMSLESVKRRSALVFWITVTMVILAFVLLLRKGNLVTKIINDGWLPQALLTGSVITWVVIWGIRHLHIAGLQKRLQKGEPLNRSKNWKQGRWLRRIWIALPWLILYCYYTVNAFSVSPIVDNELPAAEYQDSLPFIIMEEMAPEREYVSDGGQYLSRWSTPLSPVNFYWTENAYLEDPEQPRWFGGLEIYYHEAAAEWIAETIIKEYTAEVEARQIYTAAPSITYRFSDDPSVQYEFDHLAVYEGFGGVQILIRDGNTVMRVICSVHVWGENDYLYPLWLDLTAEKLK